MVVMSHPFCGASVDPVNEHEHEHDIATAVHLYVSRIREARAHLTVRAARKVRGQPDARTCAVCGTYLSSRTVVTSMSPSILLLPPLQPPLSTTWRTDWTVRTDVAYSSSAIVYKRTFLTISACSSTILPMSPLHK